MLTYWELSLKLAFKFKCVFLCIFICFAYTNTVTLCLPSLVGNLHSAFPQWWSQQKRLHCAYKPSKSPGTRYRMLHGGRRPSFAPPFHWCRILRFPCFHYYNQCCNNHVINSLFMTFANLLETLKINPCELFVVSVVSHYRCLCLTFLGGHLFDGFIFPKHNTS